MGCGYDMSELTVPFEEVTIFEHGGSPPLARTFYRIRVCKRCRADWLLEIQDWFRAEPLGPDNDADEPEPGIGSGIFIREFGRKREVTRDEWEYLYGPGDPREG